MSDSPHLPPSAGPAPSGDDSSAGHRHVHGEDCAGCGHDHDHGHNHPQSILHNPAELTAEKVLGNEQEWTRRFLLFLEMAVLLLWAVMMVGFYSSGRINSYLIGEGTFRLQVLVGGLVLGVLGIFNWQMRALPQLCTHDHHEDNGHEHCGHDHDHGHDHHHGHDHTGEGEATYYDPGDRAGPHYHEGTPTGRGMALTLLALSVTAAVAFTPDDFSDQYKRNMLSAYAAQPGENPPAPLDEHRLTPEGSSPGAAGGMSLAVIEKYQPRNKDGNFELDVMQLYYSGSDPEYAKVMKGQGVETIGQVVKDTANPGPGRWRVFVLQMTCCAADARPYSLPVQFEGSAPDLQEMGWYRITGTIDYTEEKGVTTAVLKATESQPTLRPKEQRTLF